MNQKNKVVEVYGLWFADLVAIVISFTLATYIRFGNFKDMGDNLAEQRKAVLEEIVLLDAELEKLTPGTEEYDKKYSDLIEKQTKL